VAGVGARPGEVLRGVAAGKGLRVRFGSGTRRGEACRVWAKTEISARRLSDLSELRPRPVLDRRDREERPADYYCVSRAKKSGS